MLSWCGVRWCGVWCGVACGVVWCSGVEVIRCNVVQCNVVRCKVVVASGVV